MCLMRAGKYIKEMCLMGVGEYIKDIRGLGAKTYKIDVFDTGEEPPPTRLPRQIAFLGVLPPRSASQIAF